MVLAYKQERAGGKEGHSAAFEKAEAYDELHDGPIRHDAEARALADRAGLLVPMLMALAGLVITVLGGKVLVDAATVLARQAGISETVIGLTLVAVGTSLPEFITSLVAALRKHADVALGNILGSNIYNILGIGGVTGLISPTAIPPQIAEFDAPVMAAASFAVLIFAHTDLRIGRFEGALLVLGYGAYVWALWPR
jgi:cation:H+ antiporter